MGIFTKKYDIEKDNLRIEMDIDRKIYITYLNNEEIPYNRLSKRSKQTIDKKNNFLNSNISYRDFIIDGIKSSARIEELKKLGYNCDSFEYLGKVEGTMTPEIEEYLNKLTSEPHVLIGIHRIGSSLTNEQINDILTNGLIMTGHLNAVGSSDNQVSLRNNVSYYPNNKTIIKELMYAFDVHRNSKGSILIRIPDEDLKGNLYINAKDGTIRLNPKYIIGYVPVNNNHHLSEIIKPKKGLKLTKEEAAIADKLLEEYMTNTQEEKNIKIK